MSKQSKEVAHTAEQAVPEWLKRFVQEAQKVVRQSERAAKRKSAA